MRQLNLIRAGTIISVFFLNLSKVSKLTIKPLFLRGIPITVFYFETLLTSSGVLTCPYTQLIYLFMTNKTSPPHCFEVWVLKRGRWDDIFVSIDIQCRRSNISKYLRVSSFQNTWFADSRGYFMKSKKPTL